MKLYESLYILMRYKETTDHLVRIMIENNYHIKKMKDLPKQDLVHYVTLFNHILMDTDSYMVEYNNTFLHRSEPQFKERILKVRQLAGPVLKKINVWKGIRGLRNSVIAHPFRLKDSGEFVVSRLHEFNTPRTFKELVYLQAYIHIITALIISEFKEEWLKVNEYVQSQTKDLVKSVPLEQFESAMINIVDEVNSLCKNANAGYFIDINKVFEISSGRDSQVVIDN